MADERDELDEIFDGLEMAWVDVAKARSIRARERKLAELAHDYARWIASLDRTLDCNERDWFARYAEAVK